MNSIVRAALYQITMRHLPLIVTLTVMLFTASCDLFSSRSDTEASPHDDYIFESSDLSLFELNHRVKRVRSTVYYNVTSPDGADSMRVDTLPGGKVETVIYFDTLGHYVERRDERIRRDKQGRIVRWDDRRPNLRRVHGGFLRDTLTYSHISPNVVTTSGMGDFAVTVYDDRHRVVGQYTDPLTEGEHTAVFNLYRAEDPYGNWTERLSVWTTQTPGSRPHISYTLEKRDISYY